MFCNELLLRQKIIRISVYNPFVNYIESQIYNYLDKIINKSQMQYQREITYKSIDFPNIKLIPTSQEEEEQHASRFKRVSIGYLNQSVDTKKRVVSERVSVDSHSKSKQVMIKKEASIPSNPVQIKKFDQTKIGPGKYEIKFDSIDKQTPSVKFG